MEGKVMNDKRKRGVIFAALLIFIPLLTMDSISYEGDSLTGQFSSSFLDFLFPVDTGIGFRTSEQIMFQYIYFTLIALSLISITLNLATKRFVILSVIVGILALGWHILIYWSLSSLDLGIAWYIMGIGFVLLVVSPFQKKSS